MDQSNQHLPLHTQQQLNQGAVPTNFASTVADDGGNQSLNNHPPASQAAGSNPIPPLPKKQKTTRRANASARTLTSNVWDHFSKIPAENDNDMPQARCNYCKKAFYCHSKIHGTSSMSNHLPRCRDYTHVLTTDPNQTVLTFGSNNNELGATSLRFNDAACRKALAKFVILDEQAFRIVEGEGFKLLVQQLQPQFTLPSRQTITRDCYQLYLDEKIKLKAFFRSDCSRVALTTDCWTSIQNLNYLTLTAHFIDKEWNYHKRIISFSIVPNHKGETIGMHVEDVLREWGLRNVFTITVDNASSNDVAVNYLKNRLNSFNGLVLEGKFFHMRCCAHILNLVVGDGLKDLHASISSIRTAVRYVRSSPQRLAKFKECAELLRIPSNKLVCLDVSTRWNSTYLMLEAAAKFEAAFEKLEFEDLNFRHFFGTSAPPSISDWENASVFVKFLKMFYDATKVISASTHVTIHAVFHQLSDILIELNHSAMNLNTIVANIGFEMKKKYDKYWGQVDLTNQLLYFGVILDPRYKLTYVEWSFRDMYSNDPDLVRKLSLDVKEEFYQFYAWYAALHERQHAAAKSFQVASQGNSVQTFPPEAASRSARAEAYQKHLREKSSLDEKNELERYLGESCVSVNEKIDILLWWKQNSSRFPILSTLARDVLAVPVSTVASESAFSTGGRVLDSFRSSLSPQMTEALICTQNWLRPYLFQFKDKDINEDLEISESVVGEMSTTGVGVGGAAPVIGGVGISNFAGASSLSQPMNIG